MQQCKQYDDVIFFELPEDKQNELKDCYTKDMSYESLVVDINYLDQYTKKRASASFKSNFAYEEALLKAAKPVFPGNGNILDRNFDPKSTPYEVDSSKMEQTPFSHGINPTYVQVADKKKDYEHLFFNCIDKSDGDMTPEKYLEELEAAIKDIEEGIEQKVVFSQNLVQFIKEQEKRKLQLQKPLEKPSMNNKQNKRIFHNIDKLKDDYTRAQEAYNETKAEFIELELNFKKTQTTYNDIVKEKAHYEKELSDAKEILKKLSVNEKGDPVDANGVPIEALPLTNEQTADIDKAQAGQASASVEKDAERQKIREMVQTRDPAISTMMDTGQASQTGVFAMGKMALQAVWLSIKGTWALLKAAWYGVQTLAYGVRNSWSLAMQLKGFLENKPAQVELAVLLYNEVDEKLKDVNAQLQSVEPAYNELKNQIEQKAKEGVNKQALDKQEYNVNIAFERVRRFELRLEVLVMPIMTEILKKLQNDTYESFRITDDRYNRELRLLFQFPTHFSIDNFLTENKSAKLIEKDIDMPQPPSIPEIPACSNSFIYPVLHDYVSIINEFDKQSWSELVC
jgi:hypothetical protein